MRNYTVHTGTSQEMHEAHKSVVTSSGALLLKDRSGETIQAYNVGEWFRFSASAPIGQPETGPAPDGDDEPGEHGGF